MTAPVAPPATAAAASAAAFEAQQTQLRAQMIAALVALYAGSVASGAFDPVAAAKFVASMLPITLAGQRLVSQLTIVQLQSMIQPIRPIRIAPTSVTGPALRGIDPAIYYQRPFKTIKYELSRGKTLGEALDAGSRRLQTMALTDLQLAHTHTAREFIEKAAEQQPDLKITGYRRVLSSLPNHCALCIIASTQRYHREELMPIHPNCHCTVAPIYGDEDPGQIVDEDLVENLHEIIRRDLGDSYVDASGRNGLAAYRNILITEDHGELGPVLAVRNHHFRNASDIGHIRVNPKPEEVATTELIPDAEPLNLDEL